MSLAVAHSNTVAPLAQQAAVHCAAPACWPGPTPQPLTPLQPVADAAPCSASPAPAAPQGARLEAAQFLAALLAAARLELPPQQPQAQQQRSQRVAVPGDAEADSGATLRHRTLSFVRCLARSNVLQAALLSLELSGSHPPVWGEGAPPAEGLEWTCAQLLALHLRAGDANATGGTLLAALWLLEAAHNSKRSKASVCLTSWLEHLSAFSPELTLLLAVQWPTSLAKLRGALTKAQMGLLTRLGWRVHLDFHADVWPCLQLLFDLGAQPQPQQPAEQSADTPPRRPCTPGRTERPQVAAATVPAAGLPAGQPCEDWALAMHTYCANIRQQALRIRRQRALAAHRRSAAAAAAGDARLAADRPVALRPAAKRPRTAQ